MEVKRESVQATERQELLNNLLAAIKQCQIRFGGRTELATEGDSRVLELCTHLESVLKHGLKKHSQSKLRQMSELMKGSSVDPDPWHFVRQHLTRHEHERYLLLKHVCTDLGRGRAWLRSALNEHSLERYMHMFTSDTTAMSSMYHQWAFLMDQERSSMLPMMAAGLGSILFAINIDNQELNGPIASGGTMTNDDVIDVDKEPQPVINNQQGSVREKRRKKKNKIRRPASQVVSFDDEDGCSRSSIWSLDLLQDHPPNYWNSAPPTCLSSPVTSSQGNFEALNDNKDEVDHSIYSKDAVGGATCNADNRPHSRNSNESSLSDEKDEHQKQIKKSDCKFSTLLTPVSDSSVGELVPMPTDDVPSSVEDSISIPSFGEETESAAQALAMAQRMVTTATWNATPPSNVSQSVPTNRNQDEQGKSQWGGPRTRSETLTMSNDELRDALLAVLHRKEEIEEKNASLRSLLDREMEMCAALRAELTDMCKTNEDKQEKMESKVQALGRENELLKHQLKKYIGAVQMLKREKHNNVDGATSANLLGDIATTMAEAKPFVDHHYEATEYERKLVQVAEMHGELMEFNERLHRTLAVREANIRRLKDELVDLRGPLPDDNQTSDDDLSITSDYDASSQSCASRPLINIWIPSAFLSGRSTDVHHVYQVYVRIRDDEWNVYRRYSQFYSLHKTLKKKLPIIHTFDFPPKKTIGKKGTKVVEERRKRLQNYLRCVVNLVLQASVELSNNPDRETFVSILPFFRDQNQDWGRLPPTQSGRNRIPNSTLPSSSPPTLVAPLYTGL